jgi:hypothetical protein
MCSYFSLNSYSHSANVYACLDYFVNFQRDILHKAVETRIPKIFAKIARLYTLPAQVFLYYKYLLPKCYFFLAQIFYIFAFVVNRKQKYVRYSTLLHLPPSKISLCRRMLGSITGLLLLWHWQADALTARLDLIYD